MQMCNYQLLVVCLKIAMYAKKNVEEITFLVALEYNFFVSRFQKKKQRWFEMVLIIWELGGFGGLNQTF